MLRISLLGEQAITDDATGEVLTRSPRSIALVGLLVTHAGVPQPRQRIAELFWPDSTDAQALTNLRRELHHLRQAIGEETALAVTSKDLCWRDSDTSRVDVRDFDLAHRAALAGDGAALLSAIALYRGELLPGMHDDWLLDARADLENRCVELCDLLARAAAAEPAAALDAARRRIRLRPLEEIGYRTLMELQADQGDRAGAVSTYHQCASVLERELGVVPDQATREALRRLLAQPAEPRQAGGAALIGRAAELGQLHRRWEAAAAGRAGMVLVRGGAGVGKTRLVAEIAALARRQGAVVAATQCFGTSGRLALAPVADWLRTPAVQAAAAGLDPVWRTEVDRLVPSGRGRNSHVMTDAWQRLRFFEGLARALTSTRPTLLVLDNLQWCDQETLLFLGFCLSLTPEAPLLIAATVRDETLEPELEEWIARMRAPVLALHPLGAGDTAALAEKISGRALADAERALLHAATGGFPLYIVEALRANAFLPTGDLSAVLRARLSQAEPAAREVAGLAAAVGRDFTLGLLTEASDLDADTVVRAVDELWRRRIVREFRDGYDFAHDLLRDTAYQQVSPPKRWLLHRRLAQGIELLHADDVDAYAAQLAQQYARGGRPDRAVAYYRQAADVAAGTFAHAEAIRLLTEALKLVRARPAGRDRDRQELAVLEALAGPTNARHGYASTQLQHVLERSLELAESLGRKHSIRTALMELWSSRFVQGKTAYAHEAAVRALGLADADAGPEQTGAAHFVVAGSSVSLGRPAEGLRHFELGAELTPGSRSWPIGTRPDVHGRAWAAHAHWLLGDDAAATACSRDAIDLARTLDHPYSLAIALAYAGITHQMRHDRPALEAVVAELRALCDGYDFAYYREWALVLGGWAAGPAGREPARRGIANLKAEGSFARMPYWLSLLAEVSEPAAAVATLDAALVTGQAHDDVWWLPEVLRLRAAHDDDAVPRLRTAAAMARAHGSVALLRRCQKDLAAQGVRPVNPPL